MTSSAVFDPDRLAAVLEAALIDTEPEVQFDELTRAAATLLGAPFAFLTAVDTERSFWKSTFGIEDGTSSNRVEESFCQYVIESEAALLVDDAPNHERVADNPSIESMGLRAWAGCPVTYNGKVLGSFCVVDIQPRRWTESDREVLQRLTDIAEREIELRVQLRKAESEADEARTQVEIYHELLETLRESLQPASMPVIPGYDYTTWHRAATDGHELLGDFYDSFSLPGGRWGVVIGDVCGHGAVAARLTSLVRYTLRAAAMQVDDPGEALRIVDAAIKADRTEEYRFATVFFATFDPEADDGRVRYARGGHPRPLVRRRDGSVAVLDGGDGPLLGIVPEPVFESATAELAAGESLVMFTDGLVESRNDVGAQLGADTVTEVLVRSPKEATTYELLEELVERVETHSAELVDDVAVVVVQRTAAC